MLAGLVGAGHLLPLRPSREYTPRCCPSPSTSSTAAVHPTHQHLCYPFITLLTHPLRHPAHQHLTTNTTLQTFAICPLSASLSPACSVTPARPSNHRPCPLPAINPTLAVSCPLISPALSPTLSPPPRPSPLPPLPRTPSTRTTGRPTPLSPPRAWHRWWVTTCCAPTLCECRRPLTPRPATRCCSRWVLGVFGGCCAELA